MELRSVARWRFQQHMQSVRAAADLERRIRRRVDLRILRRPLFKRARSNIRISIRIALSGIQPFSAHVIKPTIVPFVSMLWIAWYVSSLHLVFREDTWKEHGHFSLVCSVGGPSLGESFSFDMRDAGELD